MSKKVAIAAVNPVNGLGLFQYLEGFYENKIEYKVFAVAPDVNIKSNSGIALKVDGTIGELVGRADEYDALVFSCGDAVPVFAQHAGEPYNMALFKVIKEFADKGKMMIGHCGAGLIFDLAGAGAGHKVAVHPMVKAIVQKAVATDAPYEIDGNFYTAQEEHELPLLMPHLIEVLK